MGSISLIPLYLLPILTLTPPFMLTFLFTIGEILEYRSIEYDQKYICRVYHEVNATDRSMALTVNLYQTYGVLERKLDSKYIKNSKSPIIWEQEACNDIYSTFKTR